MHRYIVSMDDDTRRERCSGSHELQEWFDQGFIKGKQWVFDVRFKTWAKVADVISSNRRRSSVDIYDDVDQTLTDLSDVAAQLQEMLKR